ncbi:MAG: hypothetical protein ACI85F_001018 [Bacteroidia bacterium]|jgi:hypothetical protein
MKKLLSLGLIAAFIGFQGCSTDFDVAGDYKELSIVYGLLDLNDNPSNGGSGHNIRVQKAFLGEIDAAIMASTPDSSYFPVEDLMVTLTEYDAQGDAKNHFVLSDIMIDGKDTTGGYGFFGPDQRVYHTDENLVGGNEYELLVHNTKSGYRDSARVELINSNSFRFTAPNSNVPKLLFHDPSNGYRPRTITVSNPAGVKTGELWLRFHYREVLDGNPDTLFKQLDMQITTFIFENIGTPNNFSIAFNGETFYQTLGTTLEPLVGGHRLSGIRYNPVNAANDAAELFVHIGGTDLYDYITINAPSTSGSLTDNVVYSNMAVGKGLFSSRSQEFFPVYLFLDGFSTQQLMSGQYTSDLGFTE